MTDEAIKKCKHYHKTIVNLYEVFKEDQDLLEQIYHSQPIVNTDIYHDEVYYASESFPEISMRSKEFDTIGHMRFGLRVRTEEPIQAIDRIKEILKKQDADDIVEIESISEYRDGIDELLLEIPSALSTAEKIDGE